MGFLSRSSSKGDKSKARFVGTVQTEWLVSATDSDRNMRLLSDFAFIDRNGRRWTAPTGTVINGANIPRSLWYWVGSPFVGDYRRASVVHDYYTKPANRKLATYQEVHRMLYEAIIGDGVKKRRAKKIYRAVLRKGPRWPDPKK